MGDDPLVQFTNARGTEVSISASMIRKYLCPIATDEEIYQFLMLCQYQQLNPWLREAYLIKYDRTRPASFVVGKDVFLQRAERNRQFAGYEVEVYDQQGDPYRGNQGQTINHATAKVYRKDRTVPVTVTVLFSEYTTRQSSWLKMPVTMIRKVALEQGLREAFTSDFVGMYGPEEMGVDPETLPENVIEVPAQSVSASTAVPVETLLESMRGMQRPVPDDDLGEDFGEGDVPEPAEDVVHPEPDVVADPVPTTSSLPSEPLPRPAGHVFATHITPAPFAVIKHLATKFGANWHSVLISHEGRRMTPSERYFGQSLKTVKDMEAFAAGQPDRWRKGAEALVTDVNTRRGRG